MSCLKMQNEEILEKITIDVLNSALGGMTLLTGQTTITPVPNEQTSKHVTFKTPFKSKPEVFITPRSSVAGKVLLGVE